MKTLYIECNMGAAGDMLMGALLELVEEKEDFLNKLNELGIPGLNVTAEKSVKCGVTGTHMKVLVHGQEEGHVSHENHEHSHDHHGHHHEHDHEHEHTHDHHDDNHHHDAHHHHHGVNDIKEMIQALAVSDKVKEDALAVYQIIARAESQVHGVEMDQIHFHEVGTLDAIADVVGNCILMETIGAEKIIVSPIHVGSGNVHCAHGILPVPAPATALILQGIPYYSGSINGELCTPTGAALLKYFATEFGPMPVMQVNHIGYGMGYKEFEQANCIRVMLGETVEKEQGPDGQVLELACNLDDMTGEEIGFAAELLLEAGALDVYTQPITMKKSRPAVKLTAMIRPEDQEKITALLFRHTSTIGVRVYLCDRYVMNRRIEERNSPWGTVSIKVCEGYDVKKEKPEFDQIAKIAREQNLSLRDVKKEIEE